MSETKKKWMGTQPSTCDLCQQPFKNEFIDGATIMGAWGLLCVDCHKDWGCGLGVGKGQKYNLATLEKIGG